MEYKSRTFYHVEVILYEVKEGFDEIVQEWYEIDTEIDVDRSSWIHSTREGALDVFNRAVASSVEFNVDKEEVITP